MLKNNNENVCSSNLFLTVEEEVLFVNSNSNLEFQENYHDENEQQNEEEKEDETDEDEEGLFPKYFDGDLKQNIPTMFVSASGRTWFVGKKNLKKSVKRFSDPDQKDDDESKILFFHQKQFCKRYEDFFEGENDGCFSFENPLSQNFFTQHHQERFTGFTSGNGKMMFLKEK